MIRYGWTGLVIAILLVPGGVRGQNASDEPRMVAPYFLTGNTYRSRARMGQEYYVMGWVDGYSLVARRPDIEWLRECIRGWTSRQLRAVVERYLDNAPGEWNDPMHALVYRSLLEECPRTR